MSRTLSVILIAQDEADRIEACLESVAPLADEIVVYDSGSTDGTVEIARRYADRVFQTDWPGDGAQKQRALDTATGDWVLRVDADERVSPELAREIRAVMARPTIDEVAFRIRWRSFWFGEWLERGEAGVAHLNLFRREGARFSSRAIHTRLIPAPGPIGTLDGRMLHVPNRSFRHALAKLSSYAATAGEDLTREGRRSGVLRATLSGAGRFLKAYLVRGGILDGRRGFLLAVLYAQYAFNKHAAQWAGRQSQQPATPREEPPPRPASRRESPEPAPPPGPRVPASRRPPPG